MTLARRKKRSAQEGLPPKVRPRPVQEKPATDPRSQADEPCCGWSLEAGNARRDGACGVKVYGWDAVKLSDAYTLAELNLLREQVEAQHRLQQPDDIYLFDKKGRWKLERLSWAVRYRLQEGAS